MVVFLVVNFCCKQKIPYLFVLVGAVVCLPVCWLVVGVFQFRLGGRPTFNLNLEKNTHSHTHKIQYLNYFFCSTFYAIETNSNNRQAAEILSFSIHYFLKGTKHDNTKPKTKGKWKWKWKKKPKVIFVYAMNFSIICYFRVLIASWLNCFQAIGFMNSSYLLMVLFCSCCCRRCCCFVEAMISLILFFIFCLTKFFLNISPLAASCSPFCFFVPEL